MSRVVSPFIVVFIAAPALAQQAPDTTPPQAAPSMPQQTANDTSPVQTCTGTIDGHAVDASTHEPIAAATVRIGNELVASTDDTGRFTLDGRCPGPTTLVVERDDYRPLEHTVNVANHASVELEMTGSSEVIEIHAKAPPPSEMRSQALLSGAKLEKTRGRSFADALAEVPGVTQLRASTGVGKPIIRGQFGRRLLTLVDDVRHRAQEWGIDHAPEIDPFIADKIRVVRGAGGVRYGADAIGGVVLIDPPDMLAEPGYRGEAHVIGASNGIGGTLAGRLQAVTKRLPALSTQIEGSVKRLASPSAPDYALQNTGLFEWNAGASISYRTATTEYALSYRHYDARLGVCSCLRIQDIDNFLAQASAGAPVGAADYKAGFGIARPFQTAGHELALARIRWGRSQIGTFTATYSFQYDLRREYEVVRNADTAGAQFNFRLASHDLDATLELNPIHLSEHWHLRGAIGVDGMAQIHDYNGLHLVPSYTAGSAGAYVTQRLIGHSTEIEAGARYDFLTRTATIDNIDFTRLVRSGQLAIDACGSAIDPARCASHFHTLAGTVGALQRFGDNWTAKGEVSVASRAPNPDEQYLNGAAPSFPVLGLGKPDLTPETTYSSSVTVAVDTTAVKAEGSLFANRIDDYIYFGPAIGSDGAPIFDVTIRGTFPRFSTRPIDALFYGADGALEIAPLRALAMTAQASWVRAKNIADGSYLVFVPSDHYRTSLTYRAPDFGPFRNTFSTLSGAYVARQRRYDPRADFLPPPPGYFLVGAELGTETTIADLTTRFALQGANLTNARYRDYTSVGRYFADEPGWQVWLRMSVLFDSHTKAAKN